MAEGPRPSVSVRLEPDALVITFGQGSGAARQRWPWTELSAWCLAPAVGGLPEGLGILLRVAPAFIWLPHDAEGVASLIAVFAKRGVPELSADQTMALADRAQQGMARERLSFLTPDARKEIEGV